jgi:hypothetical protein
MSLKPNSLLPLVIKLRGLLVKLVYSQQNLYNVVEENNTTGVIIHIKVIKLFLIASPVKIPL